MPTAHASAVKKGRALLLPALAIAMSLWLATTQSTLAQSSGCVLVPDEQNPPQKILRCGDNLIVHEASGTTYQTVGATKRAIPRAIRLESGALLLEFHPSVARKDFQILTPHAIAAVRGTRWAVEVSPDKSSTLVLSGAVSVRRVNVRPQVILRDGEGVDVSPGSEPLVVKKWGAARVQALLARFGD